MSAQTDSFKLTFNHQALCVKQLERTGDFYKTILGFKESQVNKVDYWTDEGKRM